MFDRFNDFVARAYLASKREDGQTFVEYALIAAFVALLLIGTLTAFSTSITTELNKIGSSL
jgi:Flp pilus assembly pilin Flp